MGKNYKKPATTSSRRFFLAQEQYPRLEGVFKDIWPKERSKSETLGLFPCGSMGYLGGRIWNSWPSCWVGTWLDICLQFCIIIPILFRLRCATKHSLPSRNSGLEKVNVFWAVGKVFRGTMMGLAFWWILYACYILLSCHVFSASKNWFSRINHAHICSPSFSLEDPQRSLRCAASVLGSDGAPKATDHWFLSPGCQHGDWSLVAGSAGPQECRCLV